MTLCPYCTAAPLVLHTCGAEDCKRLRLNEQKRASEARRGPRDQRKRPDRAKGQTVRLPRPQGRVRVRKCLRCGERFETRDETAWVCNGKCREGLRQGVPA